jgi:fatty acid desaturase
MAVLSHRDPVPDVLPRRPELRLIERRRRADRHLFTYLVGNAIFWTLWAAAFVSADAWYWWLVVPLVGWTIVLALHLWHVASHPARASDASAAAEEEL